MFEGIINTVEGLCRNYCSSELYTRLGASYWPELIKVDPTWAELGHAVANKLVDSVQEMSPFYKAAVAALALLSGLGIRYAYNSRPNQPIVNAKPAIIIPDLAALQSKPIAELRQQLIKDIDNLQKCSQCSVCYSEYSEDDLPFKVNSSDQMYHKECIGNWIATKFREGKPIVDPNTRIPIPIHIHLGLKGRFFPEKIAQADVMQAVMHELNTNPSLGVADRVYLRLIADFRDVAVRLNEMLRALDQQQLQQQQQQRLIFTAPVGAGAALAQASPAPELEAGPSQPRKKLKRSQSNETF